MQKAGFLDLTASPEAKVALDMLRAQATRGPYVTHHNQGQAPVRSGADVVMHLPLGATGQRAYAAAIDAWLAAGGTVPFVSPVRLAPLDEAKVHDGMAELCRQRQLTHQATYGAHPSQVAAQSLDAAFQRGKKRKDMPKVLGTRPDRMAKDQKAWNLAKRLAAEQGQPDNETVAAEIFRRLRGDRLSKARRAAQRALAAAYAQVPADGIAALAARRQAQPPVSLRKDGGLPAVARLDRLAQAIARLRQDQATTMRPSGAGLKALLRATGKMARAQRIARAERELLQSRSAATRQGRIDLCLLAQADALLAMGGL